MDNPRRDSRTSLAHALNDRDGVSYRHALDRAEENASDYRAEAMEAMCDAVGAILAHAEGPDARIHAAALIDNASTIAGVAGVYDMDALGRAASSLCDLVRCFEANNVWSDDYVRVHAQTLRLISDVRRTPRSQHPAILKGLHDLLESALERYDPPDGAQS
ncbi:MAG: hypothetical protein GC189_00935 [Alphaproteobacteria bacterium]|nr:hypothetical protein [Alphaproteobacteria bacterium]